MTLLRNPWAYVALLTLLLLVLLARPRHDAPQLTRAERKHLERAQAMLQARAAADSLYSRELQQTADTYKNRGLALMKHEPITDTAAAVRFIDSVLAETPKARR